MVGLWCGFENGGGCGVEDGVWRQFWWRRGGGCGSEVVVRLYSIFLVVVVEELLWWWKLVGKTIGLGSLFFILVLNPIIF